MLMLMTPLQMMPSGQATVVPPLSPLSVMNTSERYLVVTIIMLVVMMMMVIIMMVMIIRTCLKLSTMMMDSSAKGTS